MQWFRAFIAGILATLIFHQGVFGLLHLGGVIPVAPYNMMPVPPFGVPSIVSVAFFGGLWGIPAWWVIRNRTGIGYWLLAIIFGAIAPSLVALLLVFPLKGMDVTAQTWVGAFLLNGAWGLGVAVFMKVLRDRG